MTDFAQRMQALRQRFIEQAKVEADEIKGYATAEVWSQVRDLSHRVAGRAGMFGFPELTDVARTLEEAIDAGAPPVALHDLASGLVRRLETLAD